MLCQMQKRSLSYMLTTPIATLPLPTLSSWCMPPPFVVSPQSITDPSLYSAHNTTPLVRSMDVLAQPCAHPPPNQPKLGPLSDSLTHTLTLRPLVPSSPSTQGLFSTGTRGKGCHSDNRPRRFQPHPFESPAQFRFL